MTAAVAEPPVAVTGSPRSGAERTRALIADPDGLARRMISTVLRDAGITVVAGVGDVREAREVAAHYRPDLLLLDTMVAPDAYPSLIRQILATSPQTRILTMSAEDDDAVALAALRAGAVGYVTKDLDPDRLVGLVGRAAAGEAIVPRGLVMPLLGLLQEAPEVGWRPLHSRLTTREWEIVELLAAEASTEQIASRLVLAQETVYSHVKSLLRKLKVTSRRDAVRAAWRLRHEEVSGRNLTDSAS